MSDSMKFQFKPDIIRLVSSGQPGNLIESEELQINILNNIQDGVSILDTGLNIHYVNTYMHRWYSKPDEIIGKKCFEVYHGRKEPCEECPTLQAMERKIPVWGEVRYTISGDQKGWQELLAVPIFDQNDSVLGVFEYVRDITFQHRIEEELESLMRRIESLENNNQAMMQLSRQRKEEREQLEQTIVNNFEKFVKPSLGYIKRKTKGSDVEMVEGLIDEIVYPITKKRSSKMEELTSRELQIATMIKEGKISKEIADILFISVKTVEYHRANIRKKLGLRNETGKKTNLRSYLISNL